MKTNEQALRKILINIKDELIGAKYNTSSSVVKSYLSKSIGRIETILELVEWEESESN